jgi:hypothetical protein
MVPEGLLPHIQEPSTSPYSEPNQSSPYCPSYLRLLLILSFHLLRLCLRIGLFPSGFPNKILHEEI